ncbi:hypothetical protein GQR60_12810 [Labilibaculum sp. A4]|uniref:Uncharacterized protein n=1 Tax=Labilibaculum euxinus TaxID=2686357 RepID=A0A425YAF1_9BACT|nr:hypothetical protein [Labilibaculum euxinus]MVB06101.1 hypothetical protein [Labilibaculum euxinus]MWN77221.1 hypothetical protein [Labilibaculum euxinus]
MITIRALTTVFEYFLLPIFLLLFFFRNAPCLYFFGQIH